MTSPSQVLGEPIEDLGGPASLACRRSTLTTASSLPVRGSLALPQTSDCQTGGATQVACLIRLYVPIVRFRCRAYHAPNTAAIASTATASAALK